VLFLTCATREPFTSTNAEKWTAWKAACRLSEMTVNDGDDELLIK